jgi:hypothetical protein
LAARESFRSFERARPRKQRHPRKLLPTFIPLRPPYAYVRCSPPTDTEGAGRPGLRHEAAPVWATGLPAGPHTRLDPDINTGRPSGSRPDQQTNQRPSKPTRALALRGDSVDSGSSGRRRGEDAAQGGAWTGTGARGEAGAREAAQRPGRRHCRRRTHTGNLSPYLLGFASPEPRAASWLAAAPAVQAEGFSSNPDPDWGPRWLAIVVFWGQIWGFADSVCCR